MAPALPLAALQLFVAAATVAPASPRIGAVRWDGCAAMPAGPVDPESVTGFCSTRLDLPPNRHRMPFYAKPDGRGGHVVNATKADVAREISYAQNASLSFFAFVMYGCDPAAPWVNRCSGFASCRQSGRTACSGA
jgi:hypothetical protein